VKNLALLVIGFVAGSFLTLHINAGSTETTSRDPAKLAPAMYRVVLENDRLRVIDYHLKPGEKEPLHSHPNGVFVYYLTGAAIRVSDSDGKTNSSRSKAGDMIWRGPVTHLGTNIGNSEAHMLLIEPKNFCNAASAEQSAAFDHQALHVTDLAKSGGFYERLLGFERKIDPFNDGKHLFFRIPPQGELHLIAGATATPDRDMNVHMAFHTDSVDDFVSRLKAAGVSYFNSQRENGAITLRPDGVKQVYFQDPDGYWIEVNDNHK